MPNAPKTPHRQVRVEADLWERFGSEITRAGEKDRSDVIRRFLRWYVREADAKMPRRPPATDPGE